MFRGWDSSPTGHEQPQDNSQQDQNQPEAGTFDDPGVLREWSRANKKYDCSDKKEEDMCEDPLSAGDDASSIGAWSVPNGVVETDSARNPFDVDDCSFTDYGASLRLSPGVESATHGHHPAKGTCARGSNELETVEEEFGVKSNASVFDDVDLEAIPHNMPTPTMNSQTAGPNNSVFSSHNGNEDRRSVTKRVINEMRTNPNARFKLLMAISVLLVASCIVAIAVTVSSGKSPITGQPDGGDSAVSVDSGVLSVGAFSPAMTSTPTSSPTTNSDPPTFFPTSVATSNTPSKNPSRKPSLHPSSEPTSSSPTASPTFVPTTDVPTWEPTYSSTTKSPTLIPTTFSPTMVCTDNDGKWATYNDKQRDCIWLDNGYNGAVSDRKDMNCNNSTLGDNCRYTCRLYNGCMDYLVAAQATSFNGDDYSVSDSCADKQGVYMANGNVPRNCTWLNEDPSTAPIKKNFNCGTPENPRTELGIMCPQSCAGYNGCSKIEAVSPNPIIFDEDEQSQNPTKEPAKAPINNIPNGPLMTTFDSTGTDDDGCVDLEGDWLTHEGKTRQCRWFNRGDIEYKLRMNCHITEIGLKCLGVCGCEENPTSLLEDNSLGATDDQAGCVDENGAWETSDGDRKQCEWLERFNPMERKQLNCGKTEIGLKCSCSCPNILISEREHIPSDNSLIQDSMWDYKVWEKNIGPSNAPTEKAKAPRKSIGRFSDDGDILTLIPHADASVSQENEKENFGDSSELQITKPLNSMQGLILFDLALAAESFGSMVGEAVLRIYATSGDMFGGVTFKKMADANWRESRITWNNMPGDGSDEPIVSFLDGIDGQVWYEIDVTAAVRDALVNAEPYLGIRIVSDGAVVSFSSKEEENFQPELIIDSRTMAPTKKPTANPTLSPTSSPVLTLDCLDKKGVFKSHTGQSQSCSWFDIGNGQLKKELNCQGLSDAALFCQSKCSTFNGCDGLTCVDKSGAYLTHTGVRQSCSWLKTGQGALKLEQNCGSDNYPITELGQHCQTTCGLYNGCN